MNGGNQSSKDYVAILAGFYLFVGRYYILLIVFILAGLATGIYRSQNSSVSYSKRIIYSSHLLSDEISADMIKSLQYHIDYGNYDKLAQKLNITEEASKTVRRFIIYSYKSEKDIGFNVEIRLNSDVYADTVAKGLTYYFNNNEYINKLSEVYVSERKKIIEQIDNSTGHIQNITENNSTPPLSKLPFLKNDSFKGEQSKIELLIKKAELEADILSKGKINIIDDYYNVIRSGSNITQSVTMYVIGFGFFSLFIGLLIDSFRKVRVHLKESRKH